ncbi:uncharacterized protein BDZ99DRAFT_497738, partial [Mytilinidion resinicola]
MCWPHVKLHVNNTRRDKADDQEMNMDMRLLLSPLIYSLTYEVFYMYMGSGNVAHSELPKLKEVLLKSQRLRILKLGFHLGVPTYPPGPERERNKSTYKIGITQSRENIHPLNLLLQPGDKLPPLEELHLPMQYNWSREHCQIFRSSTDWTQIRRLDIGFGCPQIFFEEFQGQTPGLKSFHTSFRQGPKRWEGAPPTCGDNPGCVVSFFDAIDALEELHISNHDNDAGILFDAILKHSQSLRKLQFFTSLDQEYRRKQPVVWGAEKLEQLREQAPNLQDLGIDIGLVGEDHTWPTDTTAVLTRFSHLHTLRLALHIPIAANEFSVKYEYDPFEGDVSPPALRIGL